MAKQSKTQPNPATVTTPPVNAAATDDFPPRDSAGSADDLDFPGTSSNGTAATNQPDPFGCQRISLSAGPGGPSMRLARSQQYLQMRIEFDEKPEEKYRQMLHAAGWKWRGPEKVWTKQLDKDAKWRGHAEAEKLFQEIGDAIRADKGLTASREVGF